VEYTHVPFEHWKLDEQTARLSANSLVRYGVSLSDPSDPSGAKEVPLWDKLRAIDPKTGEPRKRDVRILSGRALILPQPIFSLEAKVKQLFSNTPAPILDKELDPGKRDKLLKGMRQLSYLSTPLSGMVEGLLTLSQGSHIKPESKTILPNGDAILDPIEAALFSDAGFNQENVSLIQGNSALTPYAMMTKFLDTDRCPFKPVTHGQFRFTKLNIIDKFGQTLTAIDQKPHKGDPWPIYPSISDFYEPQLIKVNNEEHANTAIQNKEKQCEFIQVPPQINQNARFNADFVMRVADDPKDSQPKWSNPAKWRPASDWENPIWGWALINYADYGIQFFLRDGTFYREVRFGGPLGAALQPKWIPFDPDGPNDPRPAAAAQLDELIDKLNDPKYLEGFWYMMTTAQDNLPATPGAYAQYLNSIVGKPFALANMGWSLELDGPPLVCQSTNAQRIVPERHLTKSDDEDKSTRVYDFQVRLGDRDSEYDGLVGYFDVSSENKVGKELDLSYINTFFAPGPKEKEILPLKRLTTKTFPRFTAFWESPFPTEKPYENPSSPWYYEDRRNSKMTVFGAILDPFTAVHGYSSILPPHALQLPSWTWQAAMNTMTAFFHAGPLTIPTDVPGHNKSRNLTNRN
jgi:hypothetical protein